MIQGRRDGPPTRVTMICGRSRTMPQALGTERRGAETARPMNGQFRDQAGLRVPEKVFPEPN